MSEKLVIRELPKNPYLLAYFIVHDLDIGDEWVAADYIIWIDNKHTEYCKLHHLPEYMGLNEKHQEMFTEFLLQ